MLSLSSPILISSTCRPEMIIWARARARAGYYMKHLTDFAIFKFSSSQKTTTEQLRATWSKLYSRASVTGEI